MKKNIYSILCMLAAYITMNGQCSPTWPTSITASAYTICPGQSVFLNPNSTGNLGGAGWFQWYTSGPSGSYGFGPQTSFCGSITTPTLAAGTHYFNYHAGGGGCSGPVFPGLGSVTIYVVTPTLNVSNGSMCSGSAYTITPSGANTYTYSTAGYPDLYGSSAVVSPPVPALPSGTRIYTVTGAIAQCSQTKTLSLTITQTPTLTASSGTAICAGQQFQLQAMGATSYTVNGTSTTTLTSSYNFPAGIFNPTVTTTYTVTGATNQCAATNTIITTATVNPTPTISVSNGTICSGDSFTISPTGATSYTYSGGSAVVAPTTNTTYVITGSNGFCSSTKNVTVAVNPSPTISIPNASVCAGSSYTLNPTGATSYTYSSGSPVVTPTTSSVYTITGSNGACTSSKHVTVTVNALPSLSVSSSSSLTCPGVPFTLSASGANTYTWSGGSTASSASFTANTNSTYTLTGENNTGCRNTATFTQSVAPAISASINTSTTTLCIGQSATLTANASNATAYNWSNGSTTASTVVSPTVTSTYTVTVSNASGCSNTQTITQIVSACTNTTTGVEELYSGDSWNIYPNPANEYVIVRIPDSSDLTSPLKIDILNTLGQQIYTETTSEQSTRVSFETFGKGIYFIRLSKDKIIHVQKIMKQ